MTANSARGEASICAAGQNHVLRPTFTALVAAEEELGPLFALVERASEGQLRLTEIATLFWHCQCDQTALTRDAMGEAVMEMGLAKATGPLRILLAQILQGHSSTGSG
jgi:hypothetical protein